MTWVKVERGHTVTSKLMDGPQAPIAIGPILQSMFCSTETVHFAPGATTFLTTPPNQKDPDIIPSNAASTDLGSTPHVTLKEADWPGVTIEGYDPATCHVISNWLWLLSCNRHTFPTILSAKLATHILIGVRVRITSACKNGDMISDFPDFRFPITGYRISEIRNPGNPEIRKSEIRKSGFPDFRISDFGFRRFPDFFFFKCLIYLDPRTREKYKRNKMGNRPINP